MFGRLSLCVFLLVQQSFGISLDQLQTDLRSRGFQGVYNWTTKADTAFENALGNGGPLTLFVPNDAAVKNSTFTNIAGLLLYHLVPNGLWTNNTLGTIANHSILTTALTGHQLSFLENARPAVLACGVPEQDLGTGQIEVYNQDAPTIVSKTIVNHDLNIVYHVLNRVIDVPFSYPAWIGVLGSSWHNVALTAGMSDDSIGALQGYTFFVFQDSAYTTDLNAHLANETSIQVFNNHVILGKTIWYNLFETQNYTNQHGAQIKFTLDTDTLEYIVSAGQSNARIIRSDIVTDNGVIHIIDKTLWDVSLPANSSQTTTTSPQTSATTTSGAPTETQTSSSSGSSAGALAGRIIGSVIGGLILLVLIFLLFRHWQRKRKQPETVSEKEEPIDWESVAPTSASRPFTPLRRGASAGAIPPSNSPPSTTSGTSSTRPFSPLRREVVAPPAPANAPRIRDGLSDELVDDLLNRLAARIDPHDGQADPPVYRST